MYINILGEKHTSFCISDHLCRSNVQVLMECLTDTFEENKMEAFKIIQYCTKNGLCIKVPISIVFLHYLYCKHP